MSTVAMIGHARGDDEVAVGGLDNHTGLCSVESSCLMNNQSEVCQTELLPTVITDIRFDIDKEGRVFHCDDSNEIVDQGLCRFMEGCHASSVYPHCNSQILTTTEIVNNPDLMVNENAFDNDGLELHSYLLLYSNENCTMFEGAQGFVAGVTSFPGVSETMSCQESVACLLNPGGELCIERAGMTGEIFVIVTEPASSKSIVCSDATDGSCQEIEPWLCVKSEAFPSCWYRMVSGKTLFSKPELYLTRPSVVEIDSLQVDDPVTNETKSTDASTGILYQHFIIFMMTLGFYLVFL